MSADRAGHLLVLAVSASVIAASALLTPSQEAVTVAGFDLPPLCLFRLLTGWSCPGCGMTRSFAYMGHLEPVLAFKMHVLGPFLWTAVAAQVPWRLWVLFFGRAGGRAPGHD